MNKFRFCDRSRQKSLNKRSVLIVHEHYEKFFNVRVSAKGGLI